MATITEAAAKLSSLVLQAQFRPRCQVSEHFGEDGMPRDPATPTLWLKLKITTDVEND